MKTDEATTSKYNEFNASKKLARKGITVDSSTKKVIIPKKNNHSIGNGTWGIIDFFVNHKGYSLSDQRSESIKASHLNEKEVYISVKEALASSQLEKVRVKEIINHLGKKVPNKKS